MELRRHLPTSRAHHEYGLAPLYCHHPYRRDQIRIVGNNHRCIKESFPGVVEEMGAQIYVGPLLFHRVHLCDQRITQGDRTPRAAARPSWRVGPDNQMLVGAQGSSRHEMRTARKRCWGRAMDGCASYGKVGNRAPYYLLPLQRNFDRLHWGYPDRLTSSPVRHPTGEPIPIRHVRPGADLPGRASKDRIWRGVNLQVPGSRHARAGTASGWSLRQNCSGR